MAYKEYSNRENSGRVEFSIEDFHGIQDYYIKKIIRHTHDKISADRVKISEIGEETAPVGLASPLTSKIWTWEDHVNLDHSLVAKTGLLLARGWTVPVRTRFVIATPIYDTTSDLPFPTYNMSNVSVNKDPSSPDVLQRVPSNRHDPSTYSNYRHYLYVLPNNGICRLHPNHLPVINSGGAAVFAKTPLFIHPSNTDMLREIAEYRETPNFRSLPYIPDFAEERVWGLTEDSTCWLAGYKSIAIGDGREIGLFFNDMYNEFLQFLSTLNYEEAHREYFFRDEKAPGNLTRLHYNYLSDITRLMEAKKTGVTDIISGGGLVRDSLQRKLLPFQTKDYNFEIDRESRRIKSELLDSCVAKRGNQFKFFTKGLSSFALMNPDAKYNEEVVVPDYFDDGYRQCLVLNGEFGTSNRSFKKLHRGRVMSLYQIVDGYLSVPYEIYSTSETVSRSISSTGLSGATTEDNIHDVTKMGDPRDALSGCG